MVKKSTRHVEVFKYLLVGGINTIFGYGIFSTLLFLDFHYSIAVLVATILGVVFNFQTYGKIVFKNHSQHLIVKFILVYLVIYVVHLLLLKLADLLMGNLYLSGIVVILPIAYLGYILNKRYVWKRN